MKRNLIIIVIAVLIFTHIIPPYNISFANEEVNECENMNFTVQTIKENDQKIVGTGMASDHLTIEFKTKDKTEVVNVNSNGKFELTVEEEFLTTNDDITISNDYFKIETKVAPKESTSSNLTSEQYIECQIIEGTEEGVETTNEDSSETVESEDETTNGDSSETVESETEMTNGDSSEIGESDKVQTDEDSLEERKKTEQENEEELSSDELVRLEKILTVHENEMSRLVEEYESQISNIKENNETSNIAPFASLAEVQLLTDVVIGANLTPDTEIGPPEEGEFYNLNLNLQGTGLADVELLSPERTVVFYAPDLAGDLVHSGGAANVQVEILPVNLQEDIPVLYNAVGGLTSLLTGTLNGLLTGIDNALRFLPDDLIEVNGITELNTAINNLNNVDQALQDLTTYVDEVEYTVNPDGSISVSFSDGLGSHLETIVTGVVQGLLDDVSAAADNLEILVLNNVPLLGAILEATINPLLLGTVSNILVVVTDLSGDLTNGTIDLTENLASAQVIGNTTVNLDVLVNNPPGEVEGEIPVFGAGIQDSVIDLALLNSLQSQTLVEFPDVTNPVINTVDINGNPTEGYTVSGTGEESGDSVTVTNSSGKEVGTGTIEADGTFSILLTDEVFPDEELQVQATDEAGNESEIFKVIVPVLKLESVPNNIQFGNIEIKNEEVIFARESIDNIIEIKDTRKDDDWILTAAAPALSVDNNVLNDALIYIRNGEQLEISTEAVTVAESTDNNVVRVEDSDTITWNNNEGLLLKVNPIEAVAGKEYSTTINWTLTDGP